MDNAHERDDLDAWIADGTDRTYDEYVAAQDASDTVRLVNSYAQSVDGRIYISAVQWERVSADWRILS